MKALKTKALQFTIWGGVIFLIPMAFYLRLMYHAPCALILWTAVPFLFHHLIVASVITGLMAFCLGALVGWLGYKAFVLSNHLAKTGAILLIIMICLGASFFIIIPVCD